MDPNYKTEGPNVGAYQWIKSLFTKREPTSREELALKRLEDRIRVYRRTVAMRLFAFEKKRGRLSREQRNHITKKIEKRIAEIRAEHFNKIKNKI
jgi:hypothetical protein